MFIIIYDYCYSLDLLTLEGWWIAKASLTSRGGRVTGHSRLPPRSLEFSSETDSIVSPKQSSGIIFSRHNINTSVKRAELGTPFFLSRAELGTPFFLSLSFLYSPPSLFLSLLSFVTYSLFFFLSCFFSFFLSLFFHFLSFFLIHPLSFSHLFHILPLHFFLFLPFSPIIPIFLALLFFSFSSLLTLYFLIIS